MYGYFDSVNDIFISKVKTGRAVPVLYIPQMVPHTSFLSRQADVRTSFSCTVQTCFQQSPEVLKKSVDYDRFLTLFANILM